jgi:hypothetical protein
MMKTNNKENFYRIQKIFRTQKFKTREENMITQCCNCGASLIGANGEILCCCSNCGADYYEENSNEE